MRAGGETKVARRDNRTKAPRSPCLVIRGNTDGSQSFSLIRQGWACLLSPSMPHMALAYRTGCRSPFARMLLVPLAPSSVVSSLTLPLPRQRRSLPPPAPLHVYPSLFLSCPSLHVTILSSLAPTFSSTLPSLLCTHCPPNTSPVYCAARSRLLFFLLRPDEIAHNMVTWGFKQHCIWEAHDGTDDV